MTVTNVTFVLPVTGNTRGHSRSRDCYHVTLVFRQVTGNTVKQPQESSFKKSINHILTMTNPVTDPPLCFPTNKKRHRPHPFQCLCSSVPETKPFTKIATNQDGHDFKHDQTRFPSDLIDFGECHAE